MTHRVGSKGQVVIPRAVRERLKLASGVEVDFEERPDGVLVHRRDSQGAPLGGRFAGSGMAERLLKDRVKERR